MKRSGALQRRTPLATKTPLSSSGGLRRTALRGGKSTRLRAREAGLPAARAALRARSGGRCELVRPGEGRCDARATDPHHRCIADRERGVHDPNRMLDLCGSCHRYVHDRPALAYERGWLIRSNAIEEAPCRP